jgi:hypothetical protein
MSKTRAVILLAVAGLAVVVVARTVSRDFDRLLLAGPCSGKLPATLAATSGHELAFELSAEGVQIYMCGGATGAYAWAFQAPEANLLDYRGHPAGTHYAGPTWEGIDGSKVIGAKVASASPDPAAIPWLLLRAASPAGTGTMADVKFVQRIRTWGGMAPPDGCGASSVGAVVRVPYHAVYCFHRRRPQP